MEATAEQIRSEFSIRLSAEVARLGLPLSSPTKIAHAFNHRFPVQSVTPQTVRKWLLAEAMPMQPKLLALAEWFAVSAQWLRFGTGGREGFASITTGANPTSPSLMVLGAEYTPLIPLVEMLARLTPKDLQLVKGVIGLLLEQSKGVN